MKCKCGYEGLAEIGNFPNEVDGGKYKNLKYMNTPYRCPNCKSNKNMEHINSIDSIAKVIKLGEICYKKIPYPHKTKKIVRFFFGGADKTFISYSIHCPLCKWGISSTISLEEYETLKKEFPKYIFVGIDVNDPNSLARVKEM